MNLRFLDTVGIGVAGFECVKIALRSVVDSGVEPCASTFGLIVDAGLVRKSRNNAFFDRVLESVTDQMHMSQYAHGDFDLPQTQVAVAIGLSI